MNSSGRIAETALGRKKLIALIAIVAICAGIAAGYSAKRAIWEGWVTDRLFQIRASFGAVPPQERSPVAVIGLDQTALDSDKLSPIPRVLMTPVLAEAGQGLLDEGALALGYDFVFAYSADAFVDPITGEERLRGFDAPFQKFMFRNRERVFISHTEIGVPHRKFSAAAGTGGVRSVVISTDNDGVVRQHQPILPLSESPYLIDALLSVTGSDISEQYTALPGSRLASSIPYLSLIDVLRMLESESGREDLKEFADGRIILFGGLLPYEDEHLYSDRFLPVMSQGEAETGESGRPRVQQQTAGVLILADLIGSVLSDRIAVSPPPGFMAGVTVLFAVAGALAGLFLPMMLLPLVAASGVLLGLALSLLGLEFGMVVAPGMAPVACVSAIVVSAVGKIGILQRRQRSLVRLFGHYLAPDVIKQMAQSEQLPALGGETRHVVVAFIDIVGFTKMSEKLADRDVVRVVNSCFDAIGQVITAHQGYIDKYIGDAIMAVWNAPNTVDNPEKAAVDAAEKIIGLLEKMRDLTGQPALDLRIALNAGPVLVGDIGGEHRRSFTVMGTTVNTASRIESVAKDQKVRLAISQSVCDNLPRSYPVKEIWKGQLRGLSTDMTVFTLDAPQMYMENEISVAQDKRKRGITNLLKFPR
ncbi:adenylate/guanylate cyclase domain-containing protein [Roseibium sp. SCPC15]|uniref:adenylate/guanylate cyclase domain-containing protein n=1 Tax=Roseibium sp. SCP15 TaxID=3141376 RepID=UPI0033350E14